MVAKGAISEAKAYAKAFGGTLKSAYSNATVAMGKYGIRERVKELQAVSAAGFTMSRVEWLQSFERLATKAEAAGDLQAAKGCLREIGLAVPGWYAPDKIEATAACEVTSWVARIRSATSPVVSA